MREIELLAPARDLTTGIEAIRHGADAVYIGARKFGARAAAGNSVEDIAELVRFAHPYGVKVYVTLNTILYDSELDDAKRLVKQLAEIDVDALIVQDMALVKSQSTIHNSQLRLHASTQMDNRTAEKVAWLRNLGFEQVVLARELTLEEIREIHERVPDVRLEVFVHGAICVSYNGRCFASEHCFGRSANRGECAQFCRLPFDLIEGQGAGGKGQGAGGKDQGERIIVRQKHLLSLRDMNRSAELEALLDAGASSLKIEGRLKDVSYVKNVVAYYRQRLDEIFQRRPEYRRSSLGHETISFTPNPAKSFNRLFTDYFLHGRTPDMANIHTPKSMGEPVGKAEVKGEELRIKSEELRVHNGDGLCYINEDGQLKGFRVNRVEDNRIYLADGSTFPLHEGIRGGLYRNHDHDFEQLLSKPTAVRKVYVHWLLKEVAEGFLLRLTREDGTTVEQIFSYPHEMARSPQTGQIEQQLSRLGDTPYEATSVTVDLSDNWFVPRSVLADWRRTLTAILLQQVMPQAATPIMGELITDDDIERQRHPEKPGLLMTCRYCIRHELGMCNRSLPQEEGTSPLISGEGKVESGERQTPPLPLPLKGRGVGRGEAREAGMLFLRLADGRCFRLHFDCKRCQMMVYGTLTSTKHHAKSETT